MEIKSVHALILKDSKVLLVKRRDVPVWVLPGGGVDPQENPEEAIIREIFEETALNCTGATLQATFIAKNMLCKNTAIYICQTKGVLKKITEETIDANYFSLNQLRDIKIPPPYLEFILESLNTKHPIKKEITSVTRWLIFKALIQHPILVFRFILSRLNLHINS